MNYIQLAETCEQQEYCTDCALREGCPMRRGFYRSDEQYVKDMALTNLLALILSTSSGMDAPTSMNGMNMFTDDMDKKRKREKELYPLYSVH